MNSRLSATGDAPIQSPRAHAGLLLTIRRASPRIAGAWGRKPQRAPKARANICLGKRCNPNISEIREHLQRLQLATTTAEICCEDLYSKASYARAILEELYV